jgi:transposase-like protein
MHTEERMSYRVISKRVREEYLIRISKNTVCRIVNEIAGQSKGDIAIKQEYQPQWSGYINVDDKYIRLGGKKNMMLVATDQTGDVVHTELLEVEEQQRIDEFFRFIKEHLHYRFKGVTTDLDEMLEKSIVKELGNDVPHQKCLKHALDNIVKIVELVQKKKRITKLQEAGRTSAEEYKKADLEYVEAETIYLMSKKMLYSAGEDISLELIRELSRYGKKYPKLCEFFDRHLECLLTHQRVPAISKTNNIAENINRQLMRRLKTIESFQSFSTAENYLNLYKNYLRFKPYTDCRGRNKIKNGKAPLEVCGALLKSKDWLKNSIYSY